MKSKTVADGTGHDDEVYEACGVKPKVRTVTAVARADDSAG